MRKYLFFTLILAFFFRISVAQTRIQEPAAGHIRHDRVTIEWLTDGKSYGEIEYGKTPKLDRKISDGIFANAHTVTIRKLSPDTKYFFRIVAKNKKGKISRSGLYAFKTEGYEESDKTILKIISPPQISHLSPHKTIISWKTNHPASSIVVYGTKRRAKPQTHHNEIETETHIVTLSDLLADTRYFFRVESRGKNGRTVKSNYASFQTLKAEKQSALPAIEGGPVIVSRRAGAIQVDWKTDRPCKSFITWGEVPLVTLQQKKNVQTGYAAYHSFRLIELKPGKRYYYVIYLEDETGRKSNSEVFSVMTEKF